MLPRIILLSSVLCAIVTQGTSNEIPTKSVTQETGNASLGSTPANACSGSEWQCADGGCIPGEGRCNAVADCRDASDEYQDTCEGIERPIFRLQMLCISLSAMSQRICPQICYDQPAFCYYALMAENGRPNTCRFPKYPKHGKYSIQPLEDRSARAQGFRLDYTCDPPHVLVETDKLQCVNGTWVNGDTPRYCTEACQLYKSDEFTYVCQNSSCGDLVPVGTTVTVTRKETGRDAVSVQILCNESKVFHMSIKCVNEIDKLQENFETTTMVKMTTYESKFNQIKNDSTHDFQELVDEFHNFEHDVNRNLDMMNYLSEQCDIHLDLLLYYLSLKQINY